MHISEETGLRLRVIESEDEFALLAIQWRELATDVALTPFQTFEWNWGWWRLVGSRQSQDRLHVVVLEKEGRMRALLPLIESGASERRTARMLTAPYADYHDVLVGEDDRTREMIYAVLFGYLKQQLATRWHRIELRELPEYSRFCRYLKTRSERESVVQANESSLCPTLDMHLSAELDRCLSIREYRRKERQLSGKGCVRCHHHVTKEAISRHMDDYMSMHLRQWIPRENCGITFSDESVIRFYRGIIEDLTPYGMLQLTELRLDRRPIAFYFGFRYKGTFWAYRPAFETALKRFSPGHIMHRYLFRDLVADGFEHFDFMRGDNAYKKLYANRCPHNVDFVFSQAINPP